MIAHKRKQPVLHVKAVYGSKVREIDESGKPLMSMRFVGYDADGNIIPEGVKITYHVHYISQLKQGSLLPMDALTAQLAGVRL